MDLLTIGDVAKMLGVSEQTIRNWGVVGYLNPRRTEGGHRRYRLDDIREFQGISVVTCWEISLVQKLYAHAIDSNQREDVAGLVKPNTPYRDAELNYLIYHNFDLCNETLEEDVKEECRRDYADILHNMVVPHLVDVKPALNMVNLNSYTSCRSCREKFRPVFEMKEINVVSKELSISTSSPRTEDFERLANEVVDRSIVEMLLERANTVTTTKREKLHETIKSMIKTITKKVGEKATKKGSFWVLFPPELIPYATVELNKNLRAHFNETYVSYASRLVPRNKVLVGFKSNCGLHGAVFMPFCLMVHDKNKEYTATALCGDGLMHGGNELFGAITVDD